MPSVLEEAIGKLSSSVDTIRTEMKADQSRTKSAIDDLLGRISKANPGIDPRKHLVQVTDNGRTSGVFDDQGRFHPHHVDTSMLGRRLGTKVDPRDGQEKSFGQFMATAHDFLHPNLSPSQKQKAFEQMRDYYKVQQVSYNPNDATVIKTALAESSGVTGGYTVPPVFSDELMYLAVEGTIIGKRAYRKPLTSRTLLIPSLDQVTNNAPGKSGTGQTNLLGGMVFNWVAEAATRTETEPAFRQTELTAWELSGYLLASNTLLQDNAVGLDAWITQLITWGIEWQADYAFLRGDGVGKPMGILNAPATVTVSKAVSASFVYNDVAAMLGTLYWMLRGSKALVWVIHPSVIKWVLRMNDASASSTTGRMLFIPIDQGAQSKIEESDGVQSIGWLHGIPVLVSEKLPALAAGVTGSVLLADCSKYVVAPRMEMEIATSPHVNFLQNQMAWRVVARMDGQPWLAGPVYYADGTTAASPFVALTA